MDKYSLDECFFLLKAAQEKLALQNRHLKDNALAKAASIIDCDRSIILKANAVDVETAKKNGMKESLLDRLFLDDKRIDSMIEGINNIIRKNDPIGKILSGWTHPNGMRIEKITAPLGVAAIIYESRPNVTVDCAAIAYKAGCGILLRGSSAALESNRALVGAFRQGVSEGGGIPDAIFLAQSGKRNEIDIILNARGFIDVVIPRGGHELIRRVVENARIPVIETGEGNCHIYVDGSADPDKAIGIILNAKLQKPGACNAVETLLLHRDILAGIMPKLALVLAGKCELRCDDESFAAISAAINAAINGAAISSTDYSDLILKNSIEEDWKTEFLDNILAIKTVHSCDEAIEHINNYGTKHSEAILTNDLAAAEKFQALVDAGCIYVNASTRFTDGGEFGFGAELGISSQKFHTRGPMGLEALTTIKYLIKGGGQIRSQAKI